MTLPYTHIVIVPVHTRIYICSRCVHTHREHTHTPALFSPRSHGALPGPCPAVPRPLGRGRAPSALPARGGPALYANQQPGWRGARWVARSPQGSELGRSRPGAPGPAGARPRAGSGAAGGPGPRRPSPGPGARVALPYGRRVPAATNRPYLGVARLLNERMARAALLTP